MQCLELAKIEKDRGERKEIESDLLTMIAQPVQREEAPSHRDKHVQQNNVLHSILQ